MDNLIEGIKKRELILDYEKWRCGRKANSPNIRHGKGCTELLNSEGYMCCLGQFALQLGGIEKDIKCYSSPEDTAILFPLLTEREEETGSIINSEFSESAMRINDCRSITISEKIEALRGLCEDHGYNLKVINLPEGTKSA